MNNDANNDVNDAVNDAVTTLAHSRDNDRGGQASIAVVAGRLCAWSVLAFLCARATVDPDLWGHLRFGLDLLQTHQLTSVDPYSFTQDVPWVNHEWLSELGFGIAYSAGGVFGLLVLKGAILGAAGWLLATASRGADERLRWWLLAVSLVGLTPAAITFRPQLWTILALAALSRILSSGGPLLWIPFIFLAWANLHGGWVVGVGFCGLWLAGRLLDTRSVRAIIPTALAVAIGVAATLINPYGWRLWLFLRETVSMSRNITEWRPLWEQSDFSHGLLWALMVIVVATTIAKRWRMLTWASLFPVLWLGGSSLFVARLWPLFCEVALLATAQAWRPTGESPSVARVAMARPAGTLLIDAMAVAIVWALNAVGPIRCLPVINEASPDLIAAAAFAPPAVHGRLVLPFNWGEYALWHFGPRLRVSTDGRRETVYTQETVNLQAAIGIGRADGLEFLARERPEYVWLPMPTAAKTAGWLKENGYRLDVETSESFVGTRSDLPPLTLGAPMSSCFP